jgi:Ca2+-binding RTX toxin-like protein
VRPRSGSAFLGAAVLVAGTAAGPLLAAPAGAASEFSRVSVGADAEGDGASQQPDATPDGRHVVFSSRATNLVPGDENGEQDVFVHDRQTGTTRLVSASAEGEAGNGTSSQPSISSDGRLVSFISAASNLVPGDTNDASDLFLKDLTTGEVRRLNLTSTGGQSSGSVMDQELSGNGRFAVFSSDASDLVPAAEDAYDPALYLVDLKTSAITLLSWDNDGQGNPAAVSVETMSISENGRYTVFDSYDRVQADGERIGHNNLHVYLYDRRTGRTRVVPVQPPGGGAGIDDGFAYPVISGNGRWVFFTTDAWGLAPGHDVEGSDLFATDTRTGELTVLTPTRFGIGDFWDIAGLATNRDGSYVAFTTYDANADESITYLVHRRTGVSTRVPVADGARGLTFSGGEGDSEVFFSSESAALVDGDKNGVSDVYAWTPPPPACTITGTPRADVLVGTRGNDVICGLEGNDTIIGRGGSDSIYGGPGRDTVDYGSSNRRIVADLARATIRGQGVDRVTGIEVVIGSRHGDRMSYGHPGYRLEGGRGDDRLEGHSSVARLYGGPGNDVILPRQSQQGSILDGGAGTDTLRFEHPADADLSEARATGFDHWGNSPVGFMILNKIENLTGSSGDDRLIGDNGRNVIRGSGGSDSLFGHGGRDRLLGGAGDDMLDGGAGRDTCKGGRGSDSGVRCETRMSVR